MTKAIGDTENRRRGMEAVANSRDNLEEGKQEEDQGKTRLFARAIQRLPSIRCINSGFGVI